MININAFKLSSIDTGEVLEETSEDAFSQSETVETSKLLFELFVKENRIVYGDFSENVWKLNKPKETGYDNLTFSEIIPENFNFTLKCWILNIAPKVGNSSLREYLYLTQSFLTKTENLNASFLENVDDIIDEFTESQQNKAIYTILNFLSFADNLDNNEIFYNALENVANKFEKFSRTRTLPPYKDIILFSHFLYSYEKNWSVAERFKYFPILIWWSVTSIIPLRFGEFLDIPRNCLSIDTNGKLKLKLPRNKQPYTSNSIEVIDEVEISSELYNQIDEYIKITESFGKTETLLSYPAFRYTRKSKGIYAWTINPKRFNKDSFNLLLDEFYQDISNKEGLSIVPKIKFKEILLEHKMKNEQYLPKPNEMVKLNPNDTRHHAICTLMLQGFNRLTIARLAGHKTLEAQFHYQRHLESYAESKVYELTILNAFNEDISFRSESFELLNDIKNRSLRNPKKFLYKEKVEIGFCTDKNMDCESEDCVYCSKNYIPEEEFEENIDYLTSLEADILFKIKMRTFALERLFNEMEINYDGSYSPEQQEEYARESLTIRSLIEDLGKVKSKILF